MSEQRIRKLNRLSITVLAVMTLLACVASYIVSRSWYARVLNAKIAINGQPPAAYMLNGKPTVAEFYRRWDGELLVVLNRQDGILYRIPANRRTVYFGPSGHFTFQFSGAWNKSRPNSYGPDLGYVDGVKIASIRPDTDATLVVRDNHIEFNGLEAERIVVDW